MRQRHWIPAFAGMTIRGRRQHPQRNRCHERQCSGGCHPQRPATAHARHRGRREAGLHALPASRRRRFNGQCRERIAPARGRCRCVARFEIAGGLGDLQQAAQAAGAARELRFGEAGAALHGSGDLLVGIAFGVVQPEHAAGRVRQLLQRALQQRGIRRGGWWRAVVFGERIGVHAVQLRRQPTPATQPHQRLVDRDLPQPTPERRAAIATEAVDGGPHFQHRLL